MKKLLLTLLAAVMTVGLCSAATVYFQNTGNWSTVNMYSWTGGNNNGAWPGVKQTKTQVIEGVTYYVCETAYSMVIFNNGSGTQTKDLSVVDNGIYNASGFTGKTLGGGEVEVKVECFLSGSFANWSSSNADYKFTTTDDKVYTLKLASLADEFKVIYDGEWYGNGEKVVLGTPYVLAVVPNAPNMKLADTTATDLTLTFNATTKTLTVTGNGSEEPIVPPTPTENPALGLRGELNSWGFTAMTETDGIYTITVANLTGKFKIATNDWDDASNIYSTELTNMVVDTEYTVNVGNATADMAMASAVANATITFDLANLKLTVTGEGGEIIDPTPTPDDKYTYELHGQLTGNSNWESVKFINNNGLWEYTGDLVAGEFGIKKCENGNQVDWIGGAATINAAGTYTFKAGANSKSTLVGAYTISYDPAKGEITFTEFQGEISEDATYAIRGNMVNGEWNDYDMTETDGKWETTLVCLEGGEFGIKKLINGAQKEWYASATAADANIGAGTYVCGDLGTTNFTIKEAGEYKFSFEPETRTLVVTVVTGVNAIEAAANAPVVYYNLQGVRVASPSAGLYIRVAGNQVSKVVIR